MLNYQIVLTFQSRIPQAKTGCNLFTPEAKVITDSISQGLSYTFQIWVKQPFQRDASIGSGYSPQVCWS